MKMGETITKQGKVAMVGTPCHMVAAKTRKILKYPWRNTH